MEVIEPLRRAQRRLAGAGRQHVAFGRAGAQRSPSSCDGRDAVLYPTGWAAGFGVDQGPGALGRPRRDGLPGARLPAGRRQRRDPEHPPVPATSTSTCAATGSQTIRAKDTENGILVVTESLFSMDSDTPDLAALQELCHEFNATLLVDVAHDLGCLGDGRPRPHRPAEHARQGRHGRWAASPRPSPPTAASSPPRLAAVEGISALLQPARAPSPTRSRRCRPPIVLKAFEIVELRGGPDAARQS